jgi:hypothetical protein
MLCNIGAITRRFGWTYCLTMEAVGTWKEEEEEEEEEVGIR